MFQINYCDFNRYNQDYDKIYRPDGSGDNLFLHFLSPMTIFLPDKVITAKTNSFILFPAGSPQIYQAVKQFKNSFFHFTADEDNFSSRYALPVNEIITLPNADEISRLMQEIYLEHTSKSAFYEQKLDCLVNLLFIQLSRQLQSSMHMQSVNAEFYPIFQNARMEILSNISEDWSSEKMAALTNLSVSHFYKYYTLFFGRSPKKELLEARISHAKYLLSINHLSVNQTAALCGFQNLSHFSRYFKQLVGVSPLQYRQLSTE